MKYEVVILKSAKADWYDLRGDLTKQFGQGVWFERFAKLRAVIDNLKTFPFSGVIPDELESINLAQYRQVISGENRIIYEVRQNIVFVHLIADGRRDMKTLLTRRLLRAAE
jgi:mRNA-degrading endonuclease RelE of RelBE toxin-antitoxin system